MDASAYSTPEAYGGNAMQQRVAQHLLQGVNAKSAWDHTRALVLAPSHRVCRVLKYSSIYTRPCAKSGDAARLFNPCRRKPATSGSPKSTHADSATIVRLLSKRRPAQNFKRMLVATNVAPYIRGTIHTCVDGKVGT